VLLAAGKCLSSGTKYRSGLRVRREIPERRHHLVQHPLLLFRIAVFGQASAQRSAKDWPKSSCEETGGDFVVGGHHTLRRVLTPATALPTTRSHVRKKPSTSLSAQARVLSMGSPCMWRTVILVITPCVKICAAILGGAGAPAIDKIWWWYGFG